MLFQGPQRTMGRRATVRQGWVGAQATALSGTRVLNLVAAAKRHRAHGAFKAMAGCLSECVVEARCPKLVLDNDAFGIERSHNIGDIARTLGEANTECALRLVDFAELSEHFPCGFNMVVGHRDGRVGHRHRS